MHPLGLHGQMILNQYQKDPSLFLKKDVRRMLGVEHISVIPYVDGGWQAEMEQKNLLRFPRFIKAVDMLVQNFTEGEVKVKKWKIPFA